MATATELIVAEELRHLEELAENEGWTVTALNSESFLLGVPRKNGGELWMQCEADQYPALPPIWRWCGPHGTMVDDPRIIPVGGSSYFHSIRRSIQEDRTGTGLLATGNQTRRRAPARPWRQWRAGSGLKQERVLWE
jgi:hypothetical protein